MAIDRQSAAGVLRALADKVESDQNWTDADFVAVKTLASELNGYQLAEAARDGSIMPRASFDALPPAKQMAYVKAGGRVID